MIDKFYTELAKDWVEFLETNRNHHPIRGLAFEQWVLLQLAKLKTSKPVEKAPEKAPEKKDK